MKSDQYHYRHILDFHKPMYRVAQKSVYRKKLSIVMRTSTKRADFFINDRGMYKVSIHKEMLKRDSLLSTTIGLNKKVLLFHR